MLSKYDDPLIIYCFSDSFGLIVGLVLTVEDHRKCIFRTIKKIVAANGKDERILCHQYLKKKHGRLYKIGITYT